MMTFNEFGYGIRRFSTEWWMYVLLCLAWGSDLFFGYITHLPGIRLIGPALPYIVTSLCILNAFPALKARLNIFDISLYLIFVIVYFLYEIIFPSNADIMQTYVYTVFFSVLPMYFIGRLVVLNRLKNAFVVISCVFVLFHAWYNMIHVRDGSRDILDDNMYASYQMLPHVLLLLWYTLSEGNIGKKLIPLIFAVLGIFTIFTFGSRGPISCTLLFTCIYLFFFPNWKNKKTARILLIIIGVFCYGFIEPFMGFMDSVLVNAGFSNRVTSLFLNASFVSGSSVEARGDFQTLCMNELNNGSSIFGYGICGSWKFIQTYPHNFFVDILFSYGYLFGSIIISLILILMIRGYFSCLSMNEKVFLLLLICTSFVKLQMSGTYLLDGSLFMMLGYCITMIKNKQLKIY